MNIDRITRADLHAMLRVQRAAIAALEHAERRSAEGCRTCEHFHITRHCDRWNSTVPTDAVRAGCDDWQEDPIPF